MSSKTEVKTELEAKSLEKKLVISHPPKLRQPYPYLLICNKGKKDDCQMCYTYSVVEDRCYNLVIPELQNKNISCSYREWLVLREDSTHDCSLLNILTMDKLQLPPLDIAERNHCVFVPEKNKNDFHIFFFQGNIISKTTSCHSWDKRFFKYDIIDAGSREALMTATYFKGKMFALTLGYNLAICPLTGGYPNFTTLINGEPILKLLSAVGNRKFYLVESCGELLFIFVNYWGNKIVDVKILRADFSLREWVRLDKIGDRAIFLDKAYSYSSPASANGLKANSLYLVHECSRNLYVYDIGDQSFSMSLPCPMVESQATMLWMFVPNILCNR